MTTKKRRRRVWRPLKGLKLSTLRRKINKQVAWDCIGHIQQKSPFKMYSPGRIVSVSSRRQVTIWVPSMISMGGAERVVKPSELFFEP